MRLCRMSDWAIFFRRRQRQAYSMGNGAIESACRFGRSSCRRLISGRRRNRFGPAMETSMSDQPSKVRSSQ